MGVDKGIGSTLREARKRRGVDLAEVEATTKIRLRYLRAIENEEWDVLPGGAYTRAFIRTYATYMGLDGERLADEFRREAPRASAEVVARAEPPSPRRFPQRPRRIALGGSGGGGLKPSAWTVVAALGAIALVVAIALAIGGGGNGSPSNLKHRGKQARQSIQRERVAERKGVALKVQADGEIWVCLLDASDQPLIDGQILEGGMEEGPFHSGAYTISLGNGELTMLIDGRRTEIPPTAEPVGYRISSRGELTQLEEAERPTCT
jgi:transcriptional regulator with XRE-family HTH domain